MKSIESDRDKELKEAIDKNRFSFWGHLTRRTEEKALEILKHDGRMGSTYDIIFMRYAKQYSVCQRVLRACKVAGFTEITLTDEEVSHIF
jgi:hypothetical protein